MPRIFAASFAVIALCHLLANPLSAESASASPSPSASQLQVVDIRVLPEEVLCKSFLGFGVHGDFFMTRKVNSERGVTEKELRQVFQRIEEMRPHLIRTFFNYQWWEPEEGKQTPQSEEMRDYVLWARYLQSIGGKILLTPWGENFAYSEWMLPARKFENRFENGKEKTVSISSWSMAPKLPLPEKREATIRSLVDLVEFLRRDERLDNVEYLCLMNEPDNDPERPVLPEEYLRMNRLLDRMLRERGLRDAIQLLGPDDSGGPLESVDPWFQKTLNLDPRFFDATSSHTYVHTFDDVSKLKGWVSARREFLRNHFPDEPLPPVMITEFGYGGSTFQNLENHKYEYGLYLPDFAVTGVNSGAAAALTWCLMDTYYDRESRDTEHKQEYGLWRWLDEGWKPRPGFYSWSLMTRYTEPGSKIVAVEIKPEAKEVHAVAFLSPRGEISIPIVNRYQKDLRVKIDVGLDRTVLLRRYVYSHETIPTGRDEMIGASKVDRWLPDSTVEVDLPALSFVMLTSKI